ncbi:MAG TPA: TIGR02466 family protein [Sphingomicrobium sp.]|nr:TIGR02466 family protein [Sphingomicrobium sp.]
MSVKLEAYEVLFPTPLWCYTVENHEDLNRRLLMEIAARRKVEGDRANRNRVGWQSQHDLFDRTEPAHVELAAHAQTAMLDALRRMSSEIGTGIQIGYNGWINVNPPGGYIGPHSHPQALLSGSYYVDMPGEGDGAGDVEFVSPHAVTLMGGLIRSPMLLDKRRVKPRAGTILLFLSTQMHWVLPNRTKKERVSIAFNMSARGVPPGAIKKGR